jgi:CUG-BP- and ETR3-like factor
MLSSESDAAKELLGDSIKSHSLTNGVSKSYVRLFLGQLPNFMWETELRQLFSPYGSIIEIKVLKDKETGMHKGCGFLTFGSKEEANAAIEAIHNKTTYPPAKNPIQVKIADGELEKPEFKLFVGSLPKDKVEEEVKALFSQYGEVADVNILKLSGVSRGCCFVKYLEKEAAEAAIANLQDYKMETTMPQPTGLTVKYADNEEQKQQRKQRQTQQKFSMGKGPRYGYNPYPQPSYPQPSAYYPSYYAPYPDYPQGSYTPYQPYTQPAAYPATTATYPTAAYAAPNAAYATPNSAYAAQPHGYYYAQQTAAPPVPAQQKPRVEGPPGSNLFIFHVPPDFTDSDLHLTFAPFGNILSAQLAYDKNTGQMKCYGFVSYDNPDSANMAISQMNGVQVSGKRLKVSLKSNKSANQPY